MRHLLLALHDVTPAHIARLERAERLLASLGVATATYLLVPDFHAGAPVHESPEFIAWCRRPRAFEVRWFLHGYFHSEQIDPPRPAASLTFEQLLAARFLTAGEGEFLRLRGVQLQARLQAGLESFRQCVGETPQGFVAPAWLFNDELLPALRKLNIRYAESHVHVFDAIKRRTIAAPVISWSSRTSLRRQASMVVSALGRRCWGDRPVVRIAMHPGDFDHPRIVSNIARTVEALARNRVAAAHDALAWRTSMIQ
jgi:uncharacterized protein